MSPDLVLRAAAESDIPLLRSLAERIWRACFLAFISREQIDYMLERMYSPEVLRCEIREGVVWELACLGEPSIGYLSCAFDAAAGTLKLNKVYLLTEFQGRGLGRRLIDRAREIARKTGAGSIHLQVNRRNTRAIRAYERSGFTVVRSVVSDIGGGFFMDDHIMESRLGPAS
jgi:ribosomal protein S18 acetylase RimI-like enzyme